MEPHDARGEAVDDVLIAERKKELVAEGAVLGGIVGTFAALAAMFVARLRRPSV